MKIYTRKGDQGKTSLLGGTRVPKYDLRIEAYGTVDELNATLGLLACQEAAATLAQLLQTIQHKLFNIGSILANENPEFATKLPQIAQADIDELEASMDQMDKDLPRLRNFILAGGHVSNAIAHQARCICRRAERRVVELQDEHEVDELIPAYLNRLSDWLFVTARYLTHLTQSEEITWKA